MDFWRENSKKMDELDMIITTLTKNALKNIWNDEIEFLTHTKKK